MPTPPNLLARLLVILCLFSVSALPAAALSGCEGEVSVNDKEGGDDSGDDKDSPIEDDGSGVKDEEVP